MAEPDRGWAAGVLAVGAVVVCCGLVVAGGLGAAASGLMFGPVGFAVGTVTILLVVVLGRRRMESPWTQSSPNVADRER